MNTVSSTELARLMASDELYAVFDVRERGEYNDCQIAGATSLPRSQIEFRIADLVPDRKIPIVVYDGNDGRARLAAATLSRLDYSKTSVLENGLAGWRAEKRPTASGVNVPSKTFGERVHHAKNIPELTAEELKALYDRSGNLLVLDVRTPEEFGRFCIPGAINVPGGDLILWADELAPRQDATVVVNCAGRTRSIVGAAALRRLGLTHVKALRNGTMGWVLAGFDLELNPRRAAAPSSTSREAAALLGRRIIAEENLRTITASELQVSGMDQTMRYIIDVRSETEYLGGHMPGALNVPGGQAVQRADDFIAVRNAPVVFVSNQAARAAMAAYWYREMGFPDVLVLNGGLQQWMADGGRVVAGPSDSEPLGLAAAKATVSTIEPTALAAGRDRVVLDVGTSLEFEAAHISGAMWISRGWLELKFPVHYSHRDQAIAVACPDGRQSLLAAQTLQDVGYRSVAAVEGGVRAWTAAGLPTANGSENQLVQPNDVVVSPSIRGTKEDMVRYLEWELRLGK